MGHSRSALFWDNPNVAAAAIASVAPFLWRRCEGKIDTFLGAIALSAICLLNVVFAILLCATYSRGGLLAYVCAFIYFHCTRRKDTGSSEIWAFLPAIVGLGIGLLVTSFGRRIAIGYVTKDGSVLHRIDLWAGALRMIASSPWRGWGVHSSGNIYMNYFQSEDSLERFKTTVNSYLQVATELGLPALVILLFFLFTIIIPARPGTINANVAGVSQQARASCLAWAIANVFTTMWTQWSLWLVPGAAFTVVLWDVYRYRKRPLYIHALACCLLVSVSLLLAGEWLEAHASLRIARSWAGPTIELSAKGNVDGEVWGIWTDSRIMGQFPGKAARRFVAGLPKGSKVSVYSDSESPSPEQGSILLPGRQCERLNAVLAKDAGVTWIVLLHPYGRLPAEPLAVSARVKVRVVLPKFDQDGEAQQWSTWASRNGIEILQDSFYLSLGINQWGNVSKPHLL